MDIDSCVCRYNIQNSWHSLYYSSLYDLIVTARVTTPGDDTKHVTAHVTIAHDDIAHATTAHDDTKHQAAPGSLGHMNHLAVENFPNKLVNLH